MYCLQFDAPFDIDLDVDSRVPGWGGGGRCFERIIFAANNNVIRQGSVKVLEIKLRSEIFMLMLTDPDSCSSVRYYIL